jgi:hypothetical protein
MDSPTFRKWRNLQDGQSYTYSKIIYNKPEDEQKLLKALREASLRHHRRQEKKGLPWGIRSRHPFSYNGTSKLPAVDAAVTHPNAKDGLITLAKAVEMREDEAMVEGFEGEDNAPTNLNRIDVLKEAMEAVATSKPGSNESGEGGDGEVLESMIEGVMIVLSHCVMHLTKLRMESSSHNNIKYQNGSCSKSVIHEHNHKYICVE